MVKLVVAAKAVMVPLTREEGEPRAEVAKT